MYKDVQFKYVVQEHSMPQLCFDPQSEWLFQFGSSFEQKVFLQSSERARLTQ